jgi:hypothetical protein
MSSSRAGATNCMRPRDLLDSQYQTTERARYVGCRDACTGMLLTVGESGGLSRQAIVVETGSLVSHGIRATTPLPVFRP